MNKIYIIILTHNQIKDTLLCLSSLVKVSVKNYRTKIIIIDNASSDNTPKIIKKKYPQIRIIRNKQNLGFSKGVNQGLEIALEDKEMKYVLLLNNDTQVERNFLEKLVSTAQSKKAIGIVAPALKHYVKNQLFYGLEGHLDKNIGICTHRNLRSLRSRKLVYADFVSGCCMLIKREVLEKIGLFEEKYYLYLEDVDYCLMAKKEGFRVALDPAIVISHQVSASFSANPLAKLPHSFKSNLYFIFKWTPPRHKILAWFHCCYFYPSLAILWGLSILRRKIFRKKVNK